MRFISNCHASMNERLLDKEFMLEEIIDAKSHIVHEDFAARSSQYFMKNIMLT